MYPVFHPLRVVDKKNGYYGNSYFGTFHYGNSRMYLAR